jgi:S1-C subfamily serine protease
MRNNKKQASKNNKQHLVYAIILVLIIGVLSVYEYQQNKQLNTTLDLMNKIIKDNNNQLTSDISNLKATLLTTQKDVSGLSTSLDQKDTELKSLSGQLDQVRIESKEQLGVLSDKVSNLKIQNEDFSEVIEKSIPAVVSVKTNKGAGSGFIISSNGYIVTNYHVIEDATAATIITSDGRGRTVYLVGSNINADIAILKIDVKDHSALIFGNSQATIVGEKVIAVGNPGGLDFSVTQGIISAKRKDALNNEFLQIDVAINPGNSGGPLINAKGQVIGVNTKKIAGFEGLGFAITSNQVKEIAENLIDEYEEQLVSSQS